MDKKPNIVKQLEIVESGTLKSYIFGFLVCVILTLIAYVIIDRDLLVGKAAIAAIVTLGVVQLFVQVVCFLHLNLDPHHRLNLLVFLFMILVLLIIVIGSLWIMSNLDYRVM